MANENSSPNAGERKDLGNFHGMLHTGLASHFRAGGSRYSKTKYNPLNAFLPGHLAAWVPHVARYWFHKRHAFRDYTTPGKGTGVFPIADRATLSLVGDWATGTDEAQNVADCVREFNPDYTIHLGDIYFVADDIDVTEMNRVVRIKLGDIYFVGDEYEVKENFLGEKTSPYPPVKWPMGKLGSFALSGNHEMYARGNGYFEAILPKMGLRKSGAEWGEGQWASFLCLENKYWRIIALDSGYNATGFDWGKMPVVQKSKWIRKSVHFKPGCELTQAQLSWLRDVVNPDGDKRGLLVLTHHGCYSAFSDWYQIPAKQLAQMVHRPVIWFWGHEHKLTIYDRYHVPDGIEAYGRCIGHGGMPVERGDAPDIECPWLAWDNRRYRNGEKINVGFNGHANLSLNGPELHVEYVDLNCTLLLTEDWRVDLQSGQLHGPNLKKVLQDPSIHIRPKSS